MCDVPPDLFPDILSRLPVESLLRFRCVCTAWRGIIDDPQFIKLHLHRQIEDPQLIIQILHPKKLYTLTLESLNYSKCSGKIVVEARPLKMLFPHAFSPGSFLTLSSCNGLCLLYRFHRNIGKRLTLWNPFTRESHELPSQISITKLHGSVFQTFGFGYDYVTDDYKVVIVGGYFDNINSSLTGETLVYSLKLNSWKRVEDCPCGIPLESSGFFLNGMLHWIWSGLEGFKLLSFDLTTESYREIPLPSICGPPYLCLAVLGESLFLCSIDSIHRMDNHGRANSWTKVFSFGVGERWNIRPIHYLKSKAKVLFECNGEYFWVDIGKNIDKKSDFCGPFHTLQVCPESLVRLNTSGCISRSISQYRTRREKKMGNDDRLKLTLTTVAQYD